MKKHQAKITWAILLLLLIFLGIKLYRKNVAPKMEFISTSLTAIDNNKNLTLNDYKGNVVIVSFFQTWCTDCARETPDLNELASTLNNKNFSVIYISDEDKNLISNFHTRFLSDNILFTQSAKSLSSLGIHIYPTTYLLNKKGETILSKLEWHDWLNEKATIEKLLAE